MAFIAIFVKKKPCLSQIISIQSFEYTRLECLWDFCQTSIQFMSNKSNEIHQKYIDSSSQDFGNSSESAVWMVQHAECIIE